MASAGVHRQKADLCWKLAIQVYTEKRDEFLCMNLIFYTIGHLIESALALQHKHPSAPPRGVPHGDRGAQLRKYLVGNKWIEIDAADTYDELSALRNTFADDGIQDSQFIENYKRMAQPLKEQLEKLIQNKFSQK